MLSSVRLSLKSMKSRLISTILTLSSIALSVSLLLAVERIREGARESFENTISGTDIIVGARNSPIQLLLYSVFHMGDATKNVSWESYEKWSSHPEVSWAIPISLGDSHRGHRVVGTSEDFFTHYKYGRKQQLQFTSGKKFTELFEVVIGSDIAANLKYELGEKIVLSHGVSSISFQNHDDKPFVVSGILKKTGTPIDRSLYISLEGISAMHVDWQNGAPPMPGEEVSAENVKEMDLTPKDVTAFLLGLNAKIGIFQLQRAINNEPEEALSGILPGVTFRELWNMLGIAEAALIIVGFFVVIAGLLGMLSSLLTTLNERRREIAIIRSLGAKPRDIFFLLLSESILLGIGGCIMGILMIYLVLWISQPLIDQYFGIFIPIKFMGLFDLILVLSVFLLSLIAGCIPAFKAYRQSLSDGLSIHI